MRGTDANLLLQMNLDGETNLKIKKAPDATKDMRKESLPQFVGAVIQVVRRRFRAQGGCAT